MDRENEERVIVVGGGPVGLITALALAKRGLPVTVLEAASTPIQDPRGAAFHPPTMEMLDELGVMNILMPLGVVVPVWQIRTRGGEVIAEFDLGLLKSETAFPYRFHLGQQKVVPVLLEQLQREPLADVRFGYRVSAIHESEHGIEVKVSTVDEETSTLKGRWLIGADGARSTIRKAAGILFEGFTWPEQFLVTNLDANLADFGLAFTNYVADPDRWAVILRLEDVQGRQNWRITYPIGADQTEADVLRPDAVQERLADLVPGSNGFSVRYAGIYRVHQRVADRFRQRRVMLVGDAAHVNNPLGGFGLNSGVHDAINLASKLAEVWHGSAAEDLLDLFDRQRRTVNIKYVQTTSIRNKQILAERDETVRREAHAELRKTAADPRLSLQYLLNSSMLSSVRESNSIT